MLSWCHEWSGYSGSKSKSVGITTLAWVGKDLR